MATGLSLAAIVISAQAPAPLPRFSLAFLGHVIGEEKVTVEPTATGGRRITSDFAFTDRGTRIPLMATLELDAKGEPVHLASKGKTYRLFATDIDVTREGDSARVRDGNNEETIELKGRPFFPVDNYAPIAVQEQLIQFWMSHGRPAEIVAPPAGIVRIRSVVTYSSDPPLGAVREDYTFERLAIEGVVWGTESAIVGVKTGHLLALTTWAGNLPFEAVASGSEASVLYFVRRAAEDRIDELATLSKATAPVAAGNYALTGARVVQGTDDAAIEDGVIVIRNGRIAAVGPASMTKVPSGVRVFDAKGKTIIPGLWDMHAHSSQTDWAFPYLAEGVTTIRDMGGENEFLVPFRNAINAGTVLAPRMLLAGIADAPGPRAFGHVWVATPEEGRAYVRQLKADRFEEVKIYTGITADVVKAMSDEAHKLGMTVTGHTPRGAREAVENGYDELAHGSLPGPAGSAATNDLVGFFLAHHTVLDPTSSWGELSGRPASIQIETFIPGALRLPRTLARQFASLPGGNGDPAQYETRQKTSLGMLNEARKAGIPVVPGTDKGIPGFSLLRDIELFVKGGMTPLQAIQAASIVSARVMKLDKDTGTIEAGKRADMVVLDGNPLDDIKNIRTASRVMVNGKLYDSAALWTAAGYKK
jgi:imidazolonepropionase-like amidohydrolase